MQALSFGNKKGPGRPCELCGSRQGKITPAFVPESMRPDHAIKKDFQYVCEDCKAKIEARMKW